MHAHCLHLMTMVFTPEEIAEKSVGLLKAAPIDSFPIEEQLKEDLKLALTELEKNEDFIKAFVVEYLNSECKLYKLLNSPSWEEKVVLESVMANLEANPACVESMEKIQGFIDDTY